MEAPPTEGAQSAEPAKAEEHLSDFSDASEGNNEGVLQKRKIRPFDGDDGRPEEVPGQHPDGVSVDDDLLSYEGDLNQTKFIMKNGCCRECMKAFSKNGKVVLLLLFILI